LTKHYITESELKQLLDPDLVPWKYRIIYRILYYSALRAGELMKIKPKHLIRQTNNEDSREEYFLLLEHQKNQEKNEYTPIRLEDYTILLDYCKQHDIKKNQLIFSNRQDIPHSVSWLNRQLKKHCVKVGLNKPISSHSFRAGRVTSLKRKGLGYAEIAIITRHKNLKTLSDHYDKKIKSRAYEIVQNN